MTNSRLLAFAQLLRLPNVFTAFADICMAACAAGYTTTRPGTFALLLAASALLYLSGMAWNDFFDRRDDAKTRPKRPIPSGRIHPTTAAVLAGVLMACGVGAAGVANPSHWITVALAGGLALLVLLYDGVLKHYWIGPIAMGACRFLNVLLGMSAGEVALDTPFPFHLAAVIGVYIVGVTWFARTEEGTSQRWQLIAATVVMALAILLAVTVPVHFEEGRVPPFYYPYLLAGFGFGIGFPLVAAIRQPTPKNVQAAVKQCILGLIVFDAILATVFVGWPGLFIALLLLPAALLGKWVYST